jgi:hypothetical protein
MPDWSAMTKTGAPATKAQVRRWIRGHRAAQGAERRHAEREGPRSRRAIELALSMVEAARVAGVPPDPLRERDVAAVRATWRRLRERSSRAWQPSVRRS